MAELVVRLDDREVVRLQRILLDDDESEALAFLKEHCEPALRDLDRPHCAPTFDEGYPGSG